MIESNFPGLYGCTRTLIYAHLVKVLSTQVKIERTQKLIQNQYLEQNLNERKSSK